MRSIPTNARGEVRVCQSPESAESFVADFHTYKIQKSPRFVNRGPEDFLFRRLPHPGEILPGVGTGDLGEIPGLCAHLGLVVPPEFLPCLLAKLVEEEGRATLDALGVLDLVRFLRSLGDFLGGEFLDGSTQLPVNRESPVLLAELAVLLGRASFDHADREAGQLLQSQSVDRIGGRAAEALEALGDVLDCTGGRSLHDVLLVRLTELPAHVIKILQRVENVNYFETKNPAP